ncbi:MAG: hypothetical protein KDB00_25440, partial [Planctomycetales bacterium]|nr:hypothetical protein [Planctomycetales bacterium]
MTRIDDHQPDFSKLDAGKLLPGCSIPITHWDPNSSQRADQLRDQLHDGPAIHAFGEFHPLPIDGLSSSATSCLADSMVDVARSLRRMHQMDCCYGRITSMSFHNRGTTAAPEATLWIDPSKAVQINAVHNGDPESMYWTAERLQSGQPAKPNDDWYALGIVLAEITLSSASVHKIWELSRQDGKFVESLIKNLKRARSDRRLKAMAIALVRQGAIGEVHDATLSQLTTRGTNQNRRIAIGALAGLILLAIITSASVIYQRSVYRTASENRETEFRQRIETLESRILELETQPIPTPTSTPPVIPTVTEPPRTGSDDRERWKNNLAGRSLEQAIIQAASFQPEEWRNTLIQLQAIPGQKQWRIKDQKVRRMIQMAVDAPWESFKAEEAIERLIALNQAQARWSTWAHSQRNIEEIRTQQELLPFGLEKEFLGQWLGELLEVRSFDLQTRVVAAGADNDYLHHVIGFETEADSESLSWTWKSTEGTEESIEMQVNDYRAGQSMSFWLRQDSSIPYWDSTVISHTFDNPLLVWQLARGLKLEDSESGYAVVLTTNTRLGPPTRLDSGESATP